MTDLINKLKKSFSNKKNSNHTSNVLLIDEDDIEIKDSLSETPRKGSPRNNKHLICDDSSANRTILKKYLEICGCEVDEVENLHDAIKKVNKNGEYNIIWANINMPEKDAIECANQLRNDMHYKGAIITLTGFIDDDTEKECQKAGVNHIVCKPYDKNVIEMYTNKYLNCIKR